MSKLIRAEFERLKKSLIYKLAFLFMTLFAVFVIVRRWYDVIKFDLPEGLEGTNADGLIFLGGFAFIYVMAVFISLFVGTEYSDGTIRNKITVGHTRSSIYFSKLIVCITADLILHFLYIGITLLLGNIFINGTTMGAAEILTFSLAGAMAVTALTSFHLMLSMTIENKAVGAVACILITVVMMILALTLSEELEQPEFLSGIQRKAYTFINNYLPVSQLWQITMYASVKLGLTAVYDCVTVLITTGVGIVVFQKKNLK